MGKVLATSFAILLSYGSNQVVAATLTAVEPLVYRFDHGDITSSSNRARSVSLSFGEAVPDNVGFHLSLGTEAGDDSFGSTTFTNNFPTGTEVNNIKFLNTGVITGGQPSTWYSTPTTPESYLTITHTDYDAEIDSVEMEVVYGRGINNTGSQDRETIPYAGTLIGEDIEPTIMVLDQGYDFSVQSSETLSFSGSFEYAFDGPTLRAAFFVGGDQTLNQATGSAGYDHLNWVQIVNFYPAGDPFFAGCLSTVITGPYPDPRAGGCNGPADDAPYYYDISEDLIDTDFHIDNRGRITGIMNDNGDFSVVDVGVTFSDTPNSVFASALSPMKFTLLPVGVIDENNWEPLTDFALEWQSTTNSLCELEVFGYSFCDGSVLASSRSDPPTGIFPDMDTATGSLVALNDLPDNIKLALNENGYSGSDLSISTVPIPASFSFLLAGIILLTGFQYWGKRNTSAKIS